MMPMRLIIAATFAAAIIHVNSSGDGMAQSTSGAVLTGKAAFGDFRTDAPGVRRHITANDLPKPFDTETPRNRVEVVAKPTDAQLKVPVGFEIKQFAGGLVHLFGDANAPAYDAYFVYPEELKSVARVQVFRDFLVSKAQRWHF